MVHGDVTLREVTDGDVSIFYGHQTDPVATAMAAFPERDVEAHLAHWQRIRHDPAVTARTVLLEDRVVGNVVGWEDEGVRQIGYWIGRGHWGRGVATAALARFLEVVEERPLIAHVAADNLGSIRVLEKCGSVVADEGELDGVRELIMRLDSNGVEGPDDG